MKKRELLERIEKLEKQVATMEHQADVAADRFLELDLMLRRVLPPMPRTQYNEAAFTKGRQCGMNVLTALAGQPSMTVTTTNEQDAPLAAVATQAVKFALRDKPPSRADKEDLYRDGLACGLSSEAAWERAKMGAEAWNAKERKPQ